MRELKLTEKPGLFYMPRSPALWQLVQKDCFKFKTGLNYSMDSHLKSNLKSERINKGNNLSMSISSSDTVSCNITWKRHISCNEAKILFYDNIKI